MRIHIYLSLAGAIRLSAANPVPAVSSVDEGLISLFKRDGTCCPSEVYPDSDTLVEEYIKVQGIDGVFETDENGDPVSRPVSKRMLSRGAKVIRMPNLVPFIRRFHTTPAPWKARSVYKPKFKFALKDKDFSFEGPVYASGPRLSETVPGAKAFMPGEKILCEMAAKDLNDEQKKVAQTEHIIEVAWIKEWLEELEEKHPDIVREILDGSLEMWTQYPKISGKTATKQSVIGALMLNIGSNTDGSSGLSILERDINIAKGNLVAMQAWPGEAVWKTTSNHKPTPKLLYDKIRDVYFASEYVLNTDTKAKAQYRMKTLLRTLKTYQKLSKHKFEDECFDLPRNFLLYVRRRFTDYKKQRSIVHENNLEKWKAKSWADCGVPDSDIAEMTETLRGLNMREMNIESYLPDSLLENLEDIEQRD